VKEECNIGTTSTNPLNALDLVNLKYVTTINTINHREKKHYVVIIMRGETEGEPTVKDKEVTFTL
jgi:hypothetical protein